MNIESVIFGCPPQRRDRKNGISPAPALKLTAKRYTPVASSGDNVHGLTLLFAHCIGSHKEQWEPVISRLFTRTQIGNAQNRIREAWAVDWQSHGESAVVNKPGLNSRADGVSAFEWAEGIAVVLSSPKLAGHRIVPIGHSAGCGAVTLATMHLPLHPPPFAALVLVEPTIVTKEVYFSDIDNRQLQMDFAISSTKKRRDRWVSREEAHRWMAKRWPFSGWDTRILEQYVEHGLQYDGSAGVTLKCPRDLEALSFPDTEAHFQAAIQLTKICASIPTHLIWGENIEIVPEFIQNSLCDASAGRTIASVSRIPDAGHLVLQEKPDELAEMIGGIIEHVPVVQWNPAHKL